MQPSGPLKPYFSPSKIKKKKTNEAQIDGFFF